jgi:predicted DNA-binding helix-hairpin-helix protein
MTITFENDNDVIVYALEKVIAYARRTQQIFVAQCVWWLASIIGLNQGLINYIDNLQSRIEITVKSEAAPDKPVINSETPLKDQPDNRKSISPVSRDIQEDRRQDRLLEGCEEFIRESQKHRIRVKANTNKWNRINPLSSTKRKLRIEKESRCDNNSKTKGIDKVEIQ